jgi:RNA polymerase sigma-70 factor (ECF subfamily)
MATLQPALVAQSSGEETHLAADGGTESIAVPLARSRTISRATAIDRRRERRWIRAAQSGSEEALEQLYRRHWPWAHRAAYLVVHDAAAAEDIAQEAFLAAVALDASLPAPVLALANWIVVNRAIDRARPERRARAAVEPELEVGAGSHDRAQAGHTPHW